MGLTEKENDENYKRKLEQFKTQTQFERLKSQLEKKHKTLFLKMALGEREKVEKRCKKRPQHKEFFNRQRRLFPFFSVMNPLLLRQLRATLKRQYLHLFKVKADKLRKKIMEPSSSNQTSESDSSSGSSSKEDEPEESESSPEEYTLPKNS